MCGFHRTVSIRNRNNVVLLHFSRTINESMTRPLVLGLDMRRQGRRPRVKKNRVTKGCSKEILDIFRRVGGQPYCTQGTSPYSLYSLTVRVPVQPKGPSPTIHSQRQNKKVYTVLRVGSSTRPGLLTI